MTDANNIALQIALMNLQRHDQPPECIKCPCATCECECHGEDRSMLAVILITTAVIVFCVWVFVTLGMWWTGDYDACFRNGQCSLLDVLRAQGQGVLGFYNHLRRLRLW